MLQELPQRKQWEEVIGRAARDHEVLCEDHFSSDKIIRDYKIVLPNGRVDVIERGVIRLQPDAVPLLPVSENSIEISKNQCKFIMKILFLGSFTRT